MEADLDFRQLKIPAPQRQGYKLNLIDRLRALPGVEGVADASVVPLSGYGCRKTLSWPAPQNAPTRHLFSRK